MELLYNTTKMRECSDDMNKLITSLEKKYDELFDRIKNMPIVTHEWVGSAAEKYARVSLIEKREYDNYIDDLKRYANYLKEMAEQIDSKKEKLRR